MPSIVNTSMRRSHAEAAGPGEERLGILGPTIRADVGDRITVVSRNNTRIPVGIHPHGSFTAKRPKERII